MKKLLVCLLLNLSAVFYTQATHIVGGELNYEYLGANTYEISLTVYRDCWNGVPPFDNPASIGIFDSANAFVMEIKIPFKELDTVPPTLSSPCLVPPTNICYEVTTYIDTIVLPPLQGGYQLAYQRCCRNATILNIVNPNSTGATYYATIPSPDVVTTNSNPVFNAWPPTFLCANAPFTFDHSATDSDGDSLVYALYTPHEGATTTNPMPQPPNAPPYGDIVWQTSYSQNNMMGGVPLAINPQTGLLTATPNTIGQFVVGMKVIEYRNGVFVGETKRDFQFNVVNCPNITVAAIQHPTIVCGSNTVCFANNSFGASTYYWNFGDNTTLGDTSKNAIPCYTYPDTGTYTVMMIAYSGINSACNDTVYSTVTLYPPYHAHFGYENILCSDTVAFFDSSDTDNGVPINWDWDFGDGDSSDIQNPIHVYDTAGTYSVTLIVESSNGCKDTVTYSINYNPTITKADFNFPSVICGSFTVQFINDAEGASNYFWDFGELNLSNDTSNITNPVYTYSDTGSFTVMLIAYSQYGAECNDTIFHTVNIYPDFIGNFGFEYDPCIQVFYFTDSSDVNGNPVTWNWDFGDSGFDTTQNPAHLYGAPGFYDVVLIVEDENGCRDTINKQIEVVPLGGEVNADTLICLHDSVQLNATGGIAYHWSPSSSLSNDSIANPIAFPTAETEYSVTITIVTSTGDTCDVVRSTIVDVTTDAIPNIDATADLYLIEKGSSTILHAFPVNSMYGYTWQPAESLNNPNDTDPTASPLETTTYTLWITDENGCRSLDTVTIYIIPLDCGESDVYLPTGFTPNDDDHNDVLFVRGPDINEMYFAIYDRWGERVFETRDQTVGWDGTFNGKKLDPDVYAWYLWVKCDNENELEQKGNVTLIR